MHSFQFRSGKKLLELISENKKKTIAEIVLESEQEITGRSADEIFENMRKRLQIMKEAIVNGRDNPRPSQSGMVGGDARKISKIKGQNIFLSEVMRKASEYALGIMESNARMGKIVAAPTAGSSGIIPGGILATQEEWGLSEEKAVEGLLTAAGIGIIIASISTFSAARAGCQAEVGASSALAAAALCAMRGMPPEDCLNAAALALKNLLGLACDPIGGLVEVPCVKRNSMGIIHAMNASDMSFAGVKSVVPFDEVVQAMNSVAENMHENIRETAHAGLAISPTARKILSQKKRDSD